MKKQQKPGKILVIDDHELILRGTLEALAKKYLEAEIFTVMTADKAMSAINKLQPDLLLVMVMKKKGVEAEMAELLEELANVEANTFQEKGNILSDRLKPILDPEFTLKASYQ